MSATAASPWSRRAAHRGKPGAQDKRDAVLRAAAQLFNEKGFHATSLDDVAERLQVTKPTLYRYVESKDQILFECVRSGLRQLHEGAEASRAAGGSALDQLVAAMRTYAQIVTADFGMCVIRIGEDPLPAAERGRLRGLKRDLDLVFRRLIEQAIAEGSLRQCDARLAAFTLAGALSWIGRWYRPQGPMTPQQIADASVDLLLRGVLAPRGDDEHKTGAHDPTTTRRQPMNPTPSNPAIPSRRRLAVQALAAAGLLAVSFAAAAQESFKLGVVTFLSGPAAESFGVPAANAAKLMVEQFNAGKAPAPYNQVGFGGMKIEMVMVDEAGGAAKQVQELRNLYQRENVDAVVGYIGSGDCLAVAPVAEELKKFLVLFDCGTPRIFEESNLTYVFRTSSHATMDNVSLARYLKARNIKAETFNLINQDYAWGQDSRADFVASMAQLFPNAKPGVDLLPKFGAGQYGTEVSALSGRPADLTYSSLWGGDLQAFILQAGARGLFKDTTLVLSAGDHVLPGLLDKVPDGTVLGARGAYGILSAKTPLNDWFQAAHVEMHKVQPVQASYRITQALMGVKLAAEKAMAKNGGKKPTPEQLAEALRGSSWESPGGTIRMTLGNGQQAVQGTAIGRTKYDAASKRVIATDIQTFPAECVMPPPGRKGLEWIQAGFPRREVLSDAT